jgi:hypothetical protein
MFDVQGGGILFNISCTNMSWDADLQIIHANVKLVAEGEILIDEPLCMDVGLPALLYSTIYDVEPNRWGTADEWKRMPFFCCGCGDPECRAFSFRVRHIGGQSLQLTELEERQSGEPREQSTFLIPVQLYRQQVLAIANQYLSFIKGLDYKPYFTETVRIVCELVERAQQTGHEPGVEEW